MLRPAPSAAPARRGRRGPRGYRVAAAQRVLRPRGGSRDVAARVRARARTQPRRARFLPPRAGAGAAGPRALPRRAAEVHAADHARHRERARGLPARRVLQPRRADDGPVHLVRRPDAGGDRPAVPRRPGPGAGEHPLRAGGGRARDVVRAGLVRRRAGASGAGRGRFPAPADLHRGSAQRDRGRDVRGGPAAARRRDTAWTGSSPGRTGTSTRSPRSSTGPTRAPRATRWPS